MRIIIEAHNQGYSPEEADMFHNGHTLDELIKNLNELRSNFGGDSKVFVRQSGRHMEVYGIIMDGDVYEEE